MKAMLKIQYTTVLFLVKQLLICNDVDHSVDSQWLTSDEQNHADY